MTSMPPATGGSDLVPSTASSESTAAHAGWWPGPLVRVWILVAAAGLVIASVLCMVLVTHFSDATTLRNAQQQQEMAVSFAARALDARLETHQRVLQSIALSLHSSTLEPSAPLELQLYEASSHVGIFDALVVADQRRVTQLYAADGNGNGAAIEAQQALQQTLSDGKPLVRAITAEPESPHLRVIFTVALRNAEGVVRGGLAGISRISRHSILPAELASAQQFVLVNDDGRALAVSNAEAPNGEVRFAEQMVPAQWQSLLSSRSTSPQSERLGSHLVTRVALPLPRWNMLAVQEVGYSLHGLQRMSLWHWLGILGMLTTLAGVVVLLLMWLSRPINTLLAQPRWSRHKEAHHLVGERRRVSDRGPASKFALQTALEAEAHNVQTHLKALELACTQSQADNARLEATLEQLLQAMPIGTLWLEGQRVRYANALASRLLGLPAMSLEGKDIDVVLHEQTGAQAWQQRVMQTVQDFGHYREEVLWQSPTGQRCWLMLQGSLLQKPAQGSVWMLQDARELRSARESEQWRLLHDAASGLPNQRWLEARLQPLWTHASDALSDVAHACLWVEMDYVQILQNHAGRDAVQAVMCQLAYLLQREAPAGYAARMSESAIALWLYAPASEDAVQTLAWRLCERVEQWAPAFQGQRYGLGLSIGWWWATKAPRSVKEGLATAKDASACARREGQGKAVKAVPNW